MTRQQMVMLLEDVFEKCEREHRFGTIEIDVRDGRPVVMRELKTHKLDGENHYGQRKLQNVRVGK